MTDLPEWTNPPGVYAPLPHYSQVARAGNTLYISGQLGFDIGSLCLSTQSHEEVSC